jgi:hypothetical protein
MPSSHFTARPLRASITRQSVDLRLASILSRVGEVTSRTYLEPRTPLQQPCEDPHRHIQPHLTRLLPLRLGYQVLVVWSNMLRSQIVCPF